MKTVRSLAILAGLVLCGMAPACPPDNSFPRNLACCGNRDRRPMVAVPFSQQISRNAGEVPVELRGCRPSGEEIMAISILSGSTVAGCVGADNAVLFQNLNVQFTMRRCDANPVTRTTIVTFTNVFYTATIRLDLSPACVSNDWSVHYDTFDTHGDAGFYLLFQTGPQTLAPILDRYVLGWVASIPASPPSPATCPPRPRLGGTTSHCP